MHDRRLKTCQLIAETGSWTFLWHRRAKRRKISIRITDHQHIEVFAPWHISRQTVCDFVRAQDSWIRRHIASPTVSGQGSEQARYNDGEMFLFLGTMFPLSYQPTHRKRVRVHFSSRGWRVDVPLDMACDTIPRAIAQVLRVWYKQQAIRIVAQRIHRLGKSFGITAEQVVVRSQKRIWGSCYPSKRKIYINWKIVMAPLEVLDYVLLHECCHMRQANHSAAFWREVSASLGSYKERARWLKDHAAQMRYP